MNDCDGKHSGYANGRWQMQKAESFQTRTRETRFVEHGFGPWPDQRLLLPRNRQRMCWMGLSPKHFLVPTKQPTSTLRCWINLRIGFLRNNKSGPLGISSNSSRFFRSLWANAVIRFLNKSIHLSQMFWTDTRGLAPLVCPKTYERPGPIGHYSLPRRLSISIAPSCNSKPPEHSRCLNQRIPKRSLSCSAKLPTKATLPLIFIGFAVPPTARPQDPQI